MLERRLDYTVKLTSLPETPDVAAVQAFQIEMSEYFVVGASLPTDTFSFAQVLELYRLRWQVGLAFNV